MKTSAVSIRQLLAIIVVIAADCAVIHDCLADDAYFPFFGWPVLFRFGFAGSLPAATAVMIVGVLTLPLGSGRRPFPTGFVLSGAVALFATLGLALVLPWRWFIPVYRYGSTLAWTLYRGCGLTLRHEPFFLAVESTLFVGLFSIPELLIALAGGLLSRKFARVGGPAAEVQ